jgi:hypothetical protein
MNVETKYLRMIQGMKRRGRKDWAVYIFRYVDGSLYTGIVKDVRARVKQHSEGRGATTTRTRLPVMMLYCAFFILLTTIIGRSSDGSLSAFMMLTLLSFYILQFFETQLFGGMSIANFYFLISAISYLSISSWAMQEEPIGTACG